MVKDHVLQSNQRMSNIEMSEQTDRQSGLPNVSSRDRVRAEGSKSGNLVKQVIRELETALPLLQTVGGVGMQPDMETPRAVGSALAQGVSLIE